MPLQLDYYYGNEAEQYSFYRIPKILFTDPLFKGAVSYTHLTLPTNSLV